MVGPLVEGATKASAKIEKNRIRALARRAQTCSLYSLLVGTRGFDLVPPRRQLLCARLGDLNSKSHQKH